MKINDDGSVEFKSFEELLDWLDSQTRPEEIATWEDEGGAIVIATNDDVCPECGRRSGHKLDCSTGR